MDTLVFIHGFPLAGGAWRRQVEAFSGTHQVLSPDLPGFGGSPPVPGPTSMSTYAGGIKDLLDREKLGRAVVIGHSMGGYIALAFARAYPDRLAGLGLVSTRPGPDSPEAAAGRRATAGKVRAAGTGVVIDAMAPKMVADPALIPAVRELMQTASPDGVIGALLGMADRPDSTPFLPEIHVPVWIVTGGDDVLIPKAESERMAALIPGSTLTIIPGAGHLVSFEQPAEFNAALRMWLTSIR